jgi:hypothetical protein
MAQRDDETLVCQMPETPLSLHVASTHGLRVVLISDTHGAHRKLALPAGEVLIHAGDFTRFGKHSDATDFNEWLGMQQFEHKLVVLGNHEARADWCEEAASVLSNATVLSNSGVSITTSSAELHLPPWPPLNVFGTEFYWPVDTEHFKPPYDLIPESTDVLVAHGPALGHVDGGSGCPWMLEHVARVQPLLFVCGHIHEARGACKGQNERVAATLFVNAANAKPEEAKAARQRNKKAQLEENQRDPFAADRRAILVEL